MENLGSLLLCFNAGVFSVVEVVSVVRIREADFLFAAAQFKNICLAKIIL